MTATDSVKSPRQQPHICLGISHNSMQLPHIAFLTRQQQEGRGYNVFMSLPPLKSRMGKTAYALFASDSLAENNPGGSGILAAAFLMGWKHGAGEYDPALAEDTGLAGKAWSYEGLAEFISRINPRGKTDLLQLLTHVRNMGADVRQRIFS
ncbi:MAG: hypothetical protein JWM56_205 [Candidatus Peribacteria bacterium]|nr:hypothetical protein [Candidatus Peribacteria bacterium]